jgi:ribulose 1,5-bisphosphate carboxylase large subunit-like protein
MSSYRSGGAATVEENAYGLQLLVVDHQTRRHGMDELLINDCIDKAKARNQKQIIIHSTKFMQVTWKMLKNWILNDLRILILYRKPYLFLDSD